MSKKAIPAPPDGGWGWAVVFASFMIHVIADGVAYTFGLFIDDIEVKLGASKSEMAWIASIMAGMTYGAGPLASAFVNRFGCRAVSFAGSILAGLGFVLSYYANSVIYLYFSAGLLGGLGLGLIYLPAIVMVTCYFEKKRAFATGIAVCGSGFGTFLFAPLVAALIKLLGWRLAFVAVGGILMTCVIFSLMFRPIREKLLPADEEQTEVLPVNGPSVAIPDIVEPIQDGTDANSTSPPPSYHQVQGGQDASVFYQGLKPCNKSLLEVRQQTDTLTMSSSQPALPVGIGSMESLNRYNSLQSKKRHSLKVHSMAAMDQHGGGSETTRRRYKVQPDAFGPILERKDVFYSGSLIKIPDFSTLHEEKSSLDSSEAPQIDFDEDERPPDFVVQKTIFGCIRCSPQFYNVLTAMLRISLLKDPIFLLFAVSNFLTSIGYNVPYIYLVSMANKNTKSLDEKDEPPSTELLLSIVGMANTVSRIILGYCSDKKWVNRLHLYNGSLFGCGLATILAARATQIEALWVYSAVFGALIGVYVSLTSVILVDLLGLDKLTNAFGLLLLFQGVGTIIGPPLVGWLVDYYQDFEVGFGLAGSMIAFSGLILFVIPLLQRRQNRASLLLTEKLKSQQIIRRDLKERELLTNNNKPSEKNGSAKTNGHIHV